MIDKMTQAQKIASKLRQMIITHELTPGQRIIQEDIGKKFGVSRIPVRESLNILEAEGLVYSTPYKGSIVSDISIEFIEETYYLRSVLEGISCAQSTSNFNKDQLKELRGTMESALQSFQNKDKVSFIKYSRDFHTIIHNNSGFYRLQSILDNLRKGVSPYTPLNFLDQGKLSIKEHEYIYRKIEKGDSQGAGNAMSMHIQRAGVDIIQSIKEEMKNGNSG